jgi:hypothetical protein
MLTNYSVQVEEFTERHFIKSFQKKYKKQWDLTLVSIIAELERIDTLLLTDRAETICDAGAVKIVKTKFRVAGTKESAKTSGNRCIVAWHENKQYVAVLLVYSKTDLSGKHETAEWIKIIRDNYPAYKDML